MRFLREKVNFGHGKLLFQKKSSHSHAIHSDHLSTRTWGHRGILFVFEKSSDLPYSYTTCFNFHFTSSSIRSIKSTTPPHFSRRFCSLPQALKLSQAAFLPEATPPSRAWWSVVISRHRRSHSHLSDDPPRLPAAPPTPSGCLVDVLAEQRRGAQKDPEDLFGGSSPLRFFFFLAGKKIIYITSKPSFFGVEGRYLGGRRKGAVFLWYFIL